MIFLLLPFSTANTESLLDHYTLQYKDYSGLSTGLLFSINFRVALLLVCFQVSYPGEPSATHPTAVRFLSGVNSLVFPQVSGLREHLSTCGAAERLLPGVDALVDLHLLGPVKSLATVAANKQSFLGSGSLLNLAAVTEGLGQGESGAVMSPAVNTGGG